MGFWIRSIIFAIILIGMAVAFFINQDFLLSLGYAPAQDAVTEKVDVNKTENTSAKATSKMEKPQAKQGGKPKNAAAEGLSNFYTKIYGDDFGDKGPKVRNNIIYLPAPQGDLVELLKARELDVRPYQSSWEGTTTSRAFRKGQALYQKLEEYAKKDDLDIIWWLNRDFIIKDPFRIEKDILKTAYLIGNAVSGHFPEGISTYFCYRQRTVVFVNEAPKYLIDECTLLKSQNAY